MLSQALGMPECKVVMVRLGSFREVLLKGPLEDHEDLKGGLHLWLYKAKMDNLDRKTGLGSSFQGQ